MNAAALMDRRVNPRCAYPRKRTVSGHYLRLLITGGLFAIIVTIVTVARAAEQLPAVTVTGQATPTTKPPDTVGRDWVERSPEVHWPTAMFNGVSEIFAHNQIVINASCETIWDHLIHAELWPRWCPYSGKSRLVVDYRCCRRTRGLHGSVPTFPKTSESSPRFRPVGSMLR